MEPSLQQKRLTIGILAHVDAGKTTLTEALLFRAGALRKLGRVDHGDAFLDTHAIERSRGITIFAKQAILPLPDAELTLLDTPGHVDFAAEAERALAVLDCAILLIHGAAGIESHTRTLAKLLEERQIPTFLFCNKMDLPGAEKEKLLPALAAALGDGVVDFSDEPDEESLALASEALMEAYLGPGIAEADIRAAIAERALLPCYFGSALKLQGIDELLAGIARYAPAPAYGEAFAARILKIETDAANTRLTHLKITGGSLRVRSPLLHRGSPDAPEKVTEIRRYSGAKYQPIDEALPGMLCAIAGPLATYAGEGLGTEADAGDPALSPVLGYRVTFPAGTDLGAAMAKLRRIAEEEPQYQLTYEERTREIRISVMGPVQLEVLKKLLEDRFALSPTFSQGRILYRETIAAPIVGYGHFEPLRHYAEVHLLLEPGVPGSGITVHSDCTTLAESWQRPLLASLRGRTHRGVLTGSPITDLKITLLAGRTHPKHTESGDLREAAERALRQGLMQAENVLLAPWYAFMLELPPASVGRAMTDLERMGAEVEPPLSMGERTQLTGHAPVAALAEYPLILAGYTRGEGRLSCAHGGYRPCPDAERILQEIGYDPELDPFAPADSIFCSHGAGHAVHWSEAEAHMHIERRRFGMESPEAPTPHPPRPGKPADDAELTRIFERTYGPIKQNPLAALRPSLRPRPELDLPPVPEGANFLLVDGYNILFAWERFAKLVHEDVELARSRLTQALVNYHGLTGTEVILVFDAYRIPGNPGAVEEVSGIHVVYTREAETADMYIEKVSGALAKRHRVRVATSDRLEQLIILGHGAIRVPAAELEEELTALERDMRERLEAQARLQKSGMKIGEAMEE